MVVPIQHWPRRLSAFRERPASGWRVSDGCRGRGTRWATDLLWAQMKSSKAIAKLREAVEHHNRNDLGIAERIYRQVLAALPNQPDALHLLARACLARRNFAEAIDLIDKAIAAAPEVANFRNTACEILSGVGRLDEAHTQAAKAIEIDPSFALAHHNLCLVLYARGEFAAARAVADRVVTLHPKSAVAWLNRGVTRQELGDLRGAEEDYRQAAALAPSYRRAVLNLAGIFAESKRLDEAEEAYSNWLGDHPEDAEARFGLAGVRLMRGRDWNRAWADYEARWNIDEPGSRRIARWPLLPPRDEAASLAGSSVLVYAEGGLGDSIQMVRYVRDVSALGLRVTVLLPPALVSLAGRNFAEARALRDVKVVSELGQAAHFDFECPMLSLPGWLGLDAPPQSSSAYLSADQERAAYVCASIKAQEDRQLSEALAAISPVAVPEVLTGVRQPDRVLLRVGLVWQGGGAGAANRRRRLSLADLAPLCHLRDAAGRPLCFVSLQYGAGKQKLGNLPMVDLGNEIADFDDLAASMASVDLVVSLDTGPAHLAGALGRPVFLLVPWLHDWRWGVADRTSGWYPDMNIFRQEAPGDWRSAIDDLVERMKDRFALT